MEPPPLPSSAGRFRLRVQIYPPQEAYNLSAAALRQFTIVKTNVLALPDLTLQELCDEVVNRFKVIYPGESLFAIDKHQDSYGSDLYLGDRVRDVFEDNEVFRVIKGDTIRASVEPHGARSQSVQPNGVFQYGSAGPGKRSYNQSEAENSTRAPKRQRIVTSDPDRPVRSRERDTVEREIQILEHQVQETTVIQDSQQSTTGFRIGQRMSGLSPRITKVWQMNSSQARPIDSVDRRHSDAMARTSGPHQCIPSPPSIASSKDEAATSDSDAHLTRSRAMSRWTKQLNFIDDSSERDRGHSISTAVTTPQSVLQQSKNQSPIRENKKLRRPTVRTGKYNTADEQRNKVLPRENVYEVIETDTERLSVTPASRDVLLKINNSNKWKTYRSSTTPNSGKSGPQQRRNVASKEDYLRVLVQKQPTHEGQQKDQQQPAERERNQVAKLAEQQAEQERSRLAFKVAERRRIDAERDELEREAKLEIERVATEKLRKEIEAKKAQEKWEAEAARRQEALVRTEAAKAAQLAEKTRLEAEANSRLEEENVRLKKEERDREASEAEKLQLETETLRKAEKGNDLKEQAILQSREENKQKSQTLRASLEATVRRAARTPAKVVASHESPSANDIRSASTANSTTASNKQATCTPFIPRGRPSDNSLASLHPSLARVPSPNVGLEDQMPMPPQLNRKVSFVDQARPSALRSSTSSLLKQTTLVPQRLGFTDMRSTPKRTPLKTTAAGPKLSKGKAKVVESPGKPPAPTIEISSDEESKILTESVRQHDSFKGVGSPGPAYRNSAASQVLSSPKSQSFTNVIELDGLIEHRRGMNKRDIEKRGGEDWSSPRRSFTDAVSSASQHKKDSTPEPSSRFRLSNLSTAIPRKDKSHEGPSTQSHSSPDAAEAPQTAGNKQVDSRPPKSERSVPTDNDSEDELDSIETPDALKLKDVPPSESDNQDDETDLKEDQSEVTDEDEEGSDSDQTPSASQHSNIQENQQDDSNKLRMGFGKENANDEAQKSDDTEADLQDDSTDEEREEYSDAMQAQVDNQLLTQPFETSSTFQQASSFSNTKRELPALPKDIGPLHVHGTGRPSLRRMNLEAQRTKEANLQAAKARGLEKAQKLTGVAEQNKLLEESSEDSSSHSSSTSSEDENDHDESVVDNRSKKSSAGNAEEIHGDLNNDDVEEISEQLLAKSTGRNVPSFSRASGLKSPSKGSDLMFQPTSMPQQNGDKSIDKKSAKIGWARLGKQFSASKHKSRV